MLPAETAVPGGTEHVQTVSGRVGIYYERYGDPTGAPLVLLHDGLLGGIHEFADMIPVLAEHFTVYAIAHRGHGRSELGERALTHQLLADDAAAILRRVTRDVAVVIGYGDGATAALALAGEHPHLISRAVAISGGRATDGLTKEALAIRENLTPETVAAAHPELWSARREMADIAAPWDEFVTRVAELQNNRIHVPVFSTENIACPTLILAGDRDGYWTIEHFAELHRRIRKSSLAILPETDRAMPLHDPALLRDLILPFILAETVMETPKS